MEVLVTVRLNKIVRSSLSKLLSRDLCFEERKLMVDAVYLLV